MSENVRMRLLLTAARKYCSSIDHYAYEAVIFVFLRDDLIISIYLTNWCAILVFIGNKGVWLQVCCSKCVCKSRQPWSASAPQ